MSNYYRPPDFGIGRDAPTDDMQIGLSRAFREMSREDASEYYGDKYGQWHGQDFGKHTSMQDFLRPGKATINPPYRGKQGGR